MPVTCPPPGLFSTAIGWVTIFLASNTLAIVRATMSRPPPAPAGARIVTCFLGVHASWAEAVPARVVASSMAGTNGSRAALYEIVIKFSSV